MLRWPASEALEEFMPFDLQVIRHAYSPNFHTVDGIKSQHATSIISYHFYVFCVFMFVWVFHSYLFYRILYNKMVYFFQRLLFSIYIKRKSESSACMIQYVS